MKEPLEISSDALSLRRQLGEDSYSPIDIFSILGSTDDLTVVFYPMSDRISGACIRDNGNKLIAINSNLTHGRQRFTAAHELCHIFFHEQLNGILCAKDIDNVKDPQELEADLFASYFLAPHDSMVEYIKTRLKKKKLEIDVNDVVRIEQYYGLSRQATLRRLVTNGYLTKEQAEPMRRGIIASALKIGFDATLYISTAKEKQYNTLGRYVTLAQELKTKDLVSNGKFEELLLDAFRSDIVFGLNDDREEQYD